MSCIKGIVSRDCWGLQMILWDRWEVLNISTSSFYFIFVGVFIVFFLKWPAFFSIFPSSVIAILHNTLLGITHKKREPFSKMMTTTTIRYIVLVNNTKPEVQVIIQSDNKYTINTINVQRALTLIFSLWRSSSTMRPWALKIGNIYCKHLCP